MTREELIEALEKADGPSRELDFEIMKSRPEYVLEKRGRDRKEWFYKIGEICSRYVERIDPSYSSSGYGSLPRFTASIDAAMTIFKDEKDAVGELWVASAAASSKWEVLRRLCIAALKASGEKE